MVTPRIGMTKNVAGTTLADRVTNDAANLDLIDAGAALYLQGNIAGRPAAGVKGRIYYAEDEEKWYWDDGAAWTDMSALLHIQGNIADRPAAGIEGRIYYAEDEEKWYWDDGAAWNDMGGGGGGDVLGPASNTDGNVPQWDGTDSKTLKNGLGLHTEVGNPGTDTYLVTEQGIREGLALLQPMATLTTRGDLYQRGVADVERLAKGAQNTVLTAGANEWEAKTLTTLLDTIGNTQNHFLKRGASSWETVAFTDIRTLTAPAAAFNLEHGTVPTLYNTNGTNASIDTLAFKDAYGETAVVPSITIPSDLKSDGTVTFVLTGWAKTAAADRVVQMRVSHLQLESGTGSVDTAMTTAKDSGNLAINATQDRPVIYTWAETIANLGWVAGRRLSIGLTRIAPESGTNLTGDFLVESFEIKFPVVKS